MEGVRERFSKTVAELNDQIGELKNDVRGERLRGNRRSYLPLKKVIENAAETSRSSIGGRIELSEFENFPSISLSSFKSFGIVL